MSQPRQQIARRAERDAVRFLKKSGYRILARNFACPLGELDVVALGDEVLHFVEVKAKSGTGQYPEEAVDLHKRRKLAQLADYFVSVKRLTHLPCQFDIVAINYDPQGKAHIRHFPDAFERP
ncbi:MAG: YraN family protein [Planctomycetes bacterium]|nr:YraN family protein [Planctomycetota bacterium]